MLGRGVDGTARSSAGLAVTVSISNLAVKGDSDVRLRSAPIYVINLSFLENGRSLSITDEKLMQVPEHADNDGPKH